MAPPQYFGMVALLVFLCTGRWPVHGCVSRKEHGGPQSASLLAFSVTFGSNFNSLGLRVLSRCKARYFPLIDSGSAAADFLFEMLFVNRTTVMSNWGLVVSTFSELEDILEGQLSVVQQCSKGVFFKCYFRGANYSSPYYLQSAVRALQVPMHSSSRFLSSIRNSLSSFA